MKINKDYFPPILIQKLSGLFYGWSGNYKNWSEAQAKTIGYDANHILDIVKNAVLKVKNGEAVAERDSVIFDKIEYSYPLLFGIMNIAMQHNNTLNIIDFGGSLGSSYYQNKKFLDPINKVNWNIVEQKHFVDCGKENFQDDKLQFFYTIEDCLKTHKPNAILLSSVLQYIEEPYKLIDYIISQNFEYIIFDRTPFLQDTADRITIQKVHPKIYKASYPCWFFNEEKFTSKFNSSYELVAEFDALDRANIKSKFKGFIFKAKKQC